MADDPRKTVRAAAETITTHAHAMHATAERLRGTDPSASLKIAAWSNDLSLYAGHMLNAANSGDEETLTRVFLSDDSVHNASTIVSHVERLRTSVDRGLSFEMTEHVEALAGLPGDPIIGLPPIRR